MSGTLRIQSGSTPATPPTGYTELYVDSVTKKVQTIDDVGAISTITGDVNGPASATDGRIVRFDGATGKLLKQSTATVDDTELGHLAGVTSAIQTQINGKEPTITTLPISKGGTNSGVALSNNRVMQSTGGTIVEAAAITASRALVSDSNGIPAASSTTTTELGYVAGVTSAIQTQINAKAATPTVVSVAGDVTLTANATHLVSSAASRNLTLPAHVAGQVLWVTDSTGDCETNNFTVIRTGGGNLSGLAASRILRTNWGSWKFVDDGTNWVIL